MKKVCAIIIFTLIANCAFAAVYSVSDVRIEGQVQYVLVYKYKLNITPNVRNGDVFLPDSIASEGNYEAIVQSISEIKDVKSIKLVDSNQMRRISVGWSRPNDNLFKPLFADSKWSEFEIGYRYYTDEIHYKSVLASSIGKNFAILESGVGGDIYTEVGIQIGTTPLVSTDEKGFRLIQSEYMIGVPLTLQLDSLTVISRLMYNTSSIGSQQIKNRSKNNYLQYTSLDTLVSFEPNNIFRMYGGGGYVISSRPSTYGKWSYQAGGEARIVADSTNVPPVILAIDVKGKEESRYIPTSTFRLGVEATESITGYIELQNGYALEGTFFDKRGTHVGVGLMYH